MRKINPLYLLVLSICFCFSCGKQSEKTIESSTDIGIMTYNIRLDLTSDGINQWDNRKEAVLSIIDNYKPTIFGIQEALPQQVAYLQENLTHYGSIGKGRDGGSNGEACTILYRKDIVKLLSTETFWLSETPLKPSIGWDAAYPRICTVGVFQHKKSKKKYHVYNTHLDHVGMIAQQESVQQILAHIERQNYPNIPVIVMGDFNAKTASPTINAITKHLSDSNQNFKHKTKPTGTFNGFDIHSSLEKRIDYIFTSNLQVNNYQHLDDKTVNHNWPSDHLPVFIKIK